MQKCEDSEVSIHVGCEKWLCHSLRLLPRQPTVNDTKSQVCVQFCIEAIGRAEVKIISSLLLPFYVLYMERVYLLIQCMLASST
jgi:hypothetical protein